MESQDCLPDSPGDQGVTGDSSYETGRESHQSEPEEADLDDPLYDKFCSEIGSNTSRDSDVSSVIDNGYLEGNEETCTILWRHVEFYIVRNPLPDGRNILAAIMTLLHTKGEDRKPRM